MSFSKSALGAVFVSAFVATIAPCVRADYDIDAKAKDIVKSLVSVEVTVQNENDAAEEEGQGILLNKDGVILIDGNLISDRYPSEWIKQIKVRLPWQHFAGVPATILGRTRNHLFTYLKTDKPVDGTPFVPGDIGDVKLGQSVFAAAIMGEAGGYETYIGKSEIRTVMQISHTIVGTASFGLTRGNSPVFDATSGQFLGLTVPSLPESMTLRDQGVSRRIELLDEDQSSAFFPASEVKDLFTDIPAKPFLLRQPWLAVGDLTGLKEGVRTLKKIDQPAAVFIGSVIPNEAADKGGMKQGDIVLAINGKPFSDNPVPVMAVTHFQRAIDESKPGDKLTFTVLRGDQRLDLPIVLGTVPTTSAEVPYTYSPEIGIVTRDLVFMDAYSRRIDQDTKGVYLVLVKRGSPAALGASPLRGGLLISKVDDQPVENEKQFLDVIKREEDDPNLKEMVFVVIQPNGDNEVCRVDLTK